MRKLTCFKYYSLLFYISLVLTSCDLGNFDPIDIFTQEPLGDDVVAIETASDCGFELLVNNERIQQTGTVAQIKGSLYSNINNNEVYLGSGEFEVSTDAEGRVTALNGFANTPFYQTGYLEASVSENTFFANLALVTDGLPSVFENIELSTDGCYLYYNTSEDTINITSGSGILGFDELYINPVSEFMLYNGSLELSALQTERQWMAVDPDNTFLFEPQNSNDNFSFDSFQGNIYTEENLSITVDSILLNTVGSTTIDGAYENGGLQNFFNASSPNMQLANNGTAEVSYVFADRILDGYEFYTNADKSTRASSFLLTPSSFYFRRNDDAERVSFYGELTDSADFNNTLLIGHNALRVLEYNNEVSAIISGIYTRAADNRILSVKHSAILNLGEQGSYELRDAELVLTADEITLEGIFVSAFRTLPDIFINGNLERDGTMILTGQSLFAVSFDGTTLPVTFSVNIEVNDDEEILQISGLAEYCEGGNCNFIPVNTAIDFENEVLQLCIDIPNIGEVCIQ